jgi:anhydro-N-acetylmuramic acid kinase
MKNTYRVIGLMSGTSLDGLDIAYCEFEFENEWRFNLIQSETISYDNHWKKMLGEIHHSSAEFISEMDAVYGNFLGGNVKQFCEKFNLSPEFISSHGHTVFHQPGKGFTKQIGSGAHLAAASGFPVVCDFRSLDVAHGGQGAPLVPVGDKFLFSEYDFCLNLGGIANVSFEDKNERMAFDVCPCNLILNHYASKMGFEFDKDGINASGGKIHDGLLNELSSIDYYSKPYPKSMGREEIENDFFPLIQKYNLKTEDVLATFCKHIALQIARITKFPDKKYKMLVTGGGAFNAFLMKMIKEKSDAEIIIPDKKIIEYKEAIIFGFLGVLRMKEEINCLKSVTGARMNSCGGAIYF